MSGGGGGGYYGGGNGAGGTGNVGNVNGTPKECGCSLIRVSTPINSVQSDLLTNLAIGDRLPVEDHSGRLVVLKDDKIVGALTPLVQARIIACIADGFAYEAMVVSIDGASCIVEVSCRS